MQQATDDGGTVNTDMHPSDLRNGNTPGDDGGGQGFW